MQRRMFLLALLLSLLVVFASTAGVMADKGGKPHDAHDAGCAAYCARAVIHIKDASGNWVPWDDDGDGKVEKCLRELTPDEHIMCIKAARGICPEIDADEDGWHERCVLPKDEMGFWCKLIHGPDTHGLGH